MILAPDKSLCSPNQKVIVSRDKGTSRTHQATNPEQQYIVRHYKLDGELIKNKTCCDFVLLNDTLKNAYFIELKGGHIDDAVPQLEEGARICQPDLCGYTFYYRIVASKVRTHDVQKNSFRRFKDKHGSKLKYQTNFMEENL